MADAPKMSRYSIQKPRTYRIADKRAEIRTDYETPMHLNSLVTHFDLVIMHRGFVDVDLDAACPTAYISTLLLGYHEFGGHVTESIIRTHPQVFCHGSLIRTRFWVG